MAEPLEFAGITVDVERHAVKVDGQVVDLSALQFSLLRVLAESPGRVFARHQLIDRVWGRDFIGEERIVDVHIGNLRRTLGDSAVSPRFRDGARCGLPVRCMSTKGKPKTLRRRLFGSHLLVMLVALAVLVLGGLLVVGLLETLGEGRVSGRGAGGESGPFGLVVGLLAATVASALVSWRMAGRLAAPLEAIGQATRELAVGKYGVNVPGADTVELDAVAADVNLLAAELRTSEERRLRLIGDVAHELRNPLSTIEGTMEALIDGVVAAEEETFARIGREAARLRLLVDDLSALSSAGELGVTQRVRVAMSDLGRRAVSQLQPQADVKGLSLTVEAEGRHDVRGDADRLMQILINVIGNAIQYTETGGVSVLVAGQDRVGVDVIDTGRGLAIADQTRIFERFHRVDEQFSDGTGVGLAISKLLVEAHGGTITATSPGPGQGSSIRIELERIARPIAQAVLYGENVRQLVEERLVNRGVAIQVDRQGDVLTGGQGWNEMKRLEDEAELGAAHHRQFSIAER